MKVAISGASGLVGTALTESLRRDGHTVAPLVRGESDDPDAIAWRPDSGTIAVGGLEGVDAVVHLAGAGIGDKRWSAEFKRTLRDSRTKGTSLIARTLADLDRPPSVFVSASAIGYYGDGGEQQLTESSPRGEGFLADLVQAWEDSTEPARAAGVRTVCLRSGIILSRRGGALPPMLLPARLGLVGPMGSGRQWMSWISLADEVAAIRFLVEQDEVAGPVNLTSPQPATNREFMRTLGRVLRRPAVLPIPRFGPRLLLGRERADEMLFFSQRVEPAVLRAAGFSFQHPELDEALRAALAG